MKRILATIVLGLVWTATACAADEPKPPSQTWLYFSHRAAKTESAADIAALKPTLKRDMLVRPLPWSDGKPADEKKPGEFFQEFHAYLHNPTENTASNIVVEIDCLGEKLESEKIDKLDPDQYVRVKFQKPKAPMPAPAPGPMAGAKKVESFPVMLTANVVGEVEEARGPLEANRTVVVDILHPAEYVAVKDIQFTSDKLNGDKENNHLIVKIEALQGFTGPPCEASLNLSGIDGLRSPKKLDGRAEINQPGDTIAKLKAEGLEFDPSSPRSGRFSITVDGYARGFIYHTTFEKRPGTVQPIQVRTPAFRLRHPDNGDLSKCLLNTPFVYLLEPENIPLDAEVRIERDGKEKVLNLRGSRERQAWFAGRSEAGGLLLRGEVRDWPTSKTEFKTTDLTDKRELGFFVNNERVAVLSRGDKAETSFQFELVANLPGVDVAIKSLVRIPGGNKVRVELTPSVPVGHPAIKEMVVYSGKADDKGEVPAAVKDKGFRIVGEASKPWIAELEVTGGLDKPVEICVALHFGGAKPTVKSLSRQLADQKTKLTILVEGGTERSKMSKVSVEIVNTATNQKVFTGKTGDFGTNEHGLAFAGELPSGSYKITVSKDANNTASKTIELKGEETHTEPLYLK